MDPAYNPFDKLLETPPMFQSWYTWIVILIIGVLAGFRSYLRGPQYFGATSLKGKVAVITGGNRGIGFYIAHELATRGAKVYIGCRDEKLGSEAAALLRMQTKSKDVHFLKLRLGSFSSVRAFAAAIRKKEEKIDILVNNAGVMLCPRSKTSHGFEYHFGVNYLGHYLLTQELIDLLKAATASRIVLLSSAAYALGTINFDDINLSEVEYGNGANAFAQSKLALMLMMNKLSRELDGTGVTVNACHPGVVRSDVHRYMPIRTSQFLYVSTFPIVWYLMKTAKDGAQTPIYLCVDDQVKTATNKYFVDMQEKQMESCCTDEGLADRLWTFTHDLIAAADSAAEDTGAQEDSPQPSSAIGGVSHAHQSKVTSAAQISQSGSGERDGAPENVSSAVSCDGDNS